MEVELLWRFASLTFGRFVKYNRAVIGGPSKQQPMNSLVSSFFGSTQTPKVIKLLYKNKIGENEYAASRVFYLHVRGMLPLFSIMTLWCEGTHGSLKGFLLGPSWCQQFRCDCSSTSQFNWHNLSLVWDLLTFHLIVSCVKQTMSRDRNISRIKDWAVFPV